MNGAGSGISSENCPLMAVVREQIEMKRALCDSAPLANDSIIDGKSARAVTCDTVVT